MKAIVTHVEKQTLPQFNKATGQDEPTLVVATTVEFFKDDGTLYHTQTYAQRPEEIDANDPQAYFDKQASVLQADVEGAASHVQDEAASKLADEIVAKLTPQPDAPQED